MRANRLTFLRWGAWLPAMAVAMAIILVAGQVFHCCRFNESLSAAVSKHFKSLGHSGSQGSDGHAAKSHPGCHGHGKDPEATPPGVSVEDTGPVLKGDEICLSEVTVAPKAIPSTSLDVSGLIQSFPIQQLTADPIRPLHFERPKARNKSSPPLYLLTRRILV